MSASSDSLALLKEQLKPVYSHADLNVSEELNAVVAVLADSTNLQRSLTEVSHRIEERIALVERLFGTKISSDAIQILNECVSKRWNKGNDLVSAVEIMAQLCAMSEAETKRSYDLIENELLEFSNALEQYPELEQALESYTADIKAKKELVKKLTANFSDITQSLVQHAAVYPRGLRVRASLKNLISLVAERKQQFIAVVDTSIKLTKEQEEKLSAKLYKMYGHPIALNIRIVPNVIGGIRVRVGDEVMDGTVHSRVDGLRQKLVS